MCDQKVYRLLTNLKNFIGVDEFRNLKKPLGVSAVKRCCFRPEDVYECMQKSGVELSGLKSDIIKYGANKVLKSHTLSDGFKDDILKIILRLIHQGRGKSFLRWTFKYDDKVYDCFDSNRDEQACKESIEKEMLYYDCVHGGFDLTDILDQEWRNRFVELQREKIQSLIERNKIADCFL